MGVACQLVRETIIIMLLLLHLPRDDAHEMQRGGKSARNGDMIPFLLLL